MSILQLCEIFNKNSCYQNDLAILLHFSFQVPVIHLQWIFFFFLKGGHISLALYSCLVYQVIV